MDAAKASVKKFISRDGKHDTTIDEKVAPSVQHETINRTQHEQQTTAVDREVHQDHYHTSEQPVMDQETLAEQHHHNLRPTEHRSYEHDDPNLVKERLAQEQSKYRDSQQRVEGEHTQSTSPTVGGEHVHHHVHETIQPVVNKQTVEPHVVHTTQPIHETHHNAAQHHSSTALPAVSMADFKKQGGSLGGREERHDQFAGCPPEQFGAHKSEGMRDSGIAGAGMTGAAAGRRRGSSSSSSSSDEEKRRTKTGALGGAGAGYASNGSHSNPQPASYGNDMNTDPNTNTQHKASFMDKLNPKKDSDNDGKPGFMK